VFLLKLVRAEFAAELHSLPEWGHLPGHACLWLPLVVSACDFGKQLRACEYDSCEYVPSLLMTP